MFTTRRVLTGLGLAAVLATAGHLTARAASGNGCTVSVGGAEVGKKITAELVLFNTITTTHTLDLEILDGEGNTLVSRTGEIQLGRYETGMIDLTEQLSRDLTGKEKPYEGPVSVRVTGGDGSFREDTVLVHVAQYYGKRTKPKAAYVLPASYRDDGQD